MTNLDAYLQKLAQRIVESARRPPQNGLSYCKYAMLYSPGFADRHNVPDVVERTRERHKDSPRRDDPKWITRWAGHTLWDDASAERRATIRQELARVVALCREIAARSDDDQNSPAPGLV